ncbi:MAG: MurT ligase domain-containing protein [Acidimicrobiia bacterium]
MLSWLKLQIALFVGRIASSLSRILSIGSGEQIRGRVIAALDKNALKKLAKNKDIIVISSTNGKTTTTKLVSNALKNTGYKIISNEQGANQEAGIITALATMKNPDYCVLEVDERSLPKMFDRLQPKFLLFANLSRDQLDRFGEVSSISKSWKEMLKDFDGYIIANACDPNIVFSCLGAKNAHVSWVPINSSWHNDSYSCPNCGSLLNYFEDSSFNCSSCTFSTPSSLENVSDSLIKDISNNLNLPGKWNVNNAIISYYLLKNIDNDLRDDQLFKSFSELSSVSGRNEIFDLKNDKQVQLFLAKNPAGWNETLNHINEANNTGLIFAFNCNIADGKDPSWLYDVDFESINQENIYVFGERSVDMATRLMIAGKNPMLTNDLDEALANSQFDFNLLVASYTQFLKLSRNLAKGGRNEKN